MKEVMSGRDYYAAKKNPDFASGVGKVLDVPMAYSDAAGFLHSVDEIFYRNVYKFAAKTDAPHIIDLGANIGLSVLFFKCLYPESTIVAYEPDPKIFEILKRNVGHLPGVDLRNAAAWIEEGEMTFYSEGSLAGSSEMDFADKGNAVTVPTERLKFELAKRAVDFLKMDIEGAENSVLFDVKDELKNVESFFLEYHSVPAKPQMLGELLNLVTDAGFRYAITHERSPRLPFIEGFTHGFDLQLNVSCFRR